MSIIRTAQIVHKDKTTLTISSGVVTRTQDYHIIAAETGTSDDLDTINLDGTVNYTVNSITYRPRVLLAADAGDTITLKHGTGNLDLPNDSDVTLTDDAYLVLFYDGTNWVALAAVNVTGLANPVDLIQWNTSYSPGAHNTGNMYWDSANNGPSVDMVGSTVSLQIGQETLGYVRNVSGVTIPDGSAVYLTGVDSGLPTVALAKADNAVTTRVVGVATEEIANSSNGYVTRVGVVRDIDTSAFSPGNLLYLSESTAGEFTTTKPEEPNFQWIVGACLVSDASVGNIYVYIRQLQTLNDLTANTQDLLSAFNGVSTRSADVTVASDGATITLTVDNAISPGSDMVVKFSTGLYYWAMTDSATLTAGTDTVPVLNYVYLLESTKTLTVSTSSWPSAEHHPVAKVYCQSAASLQTDGAYNVHAYTDHTFDSVNQGHIYHINYWIRQQNATWLSDVDPSFSGSGTGTIGLSSTSGTTLQLHVGTFPAFSDPSTLYVVNDFTTKFKEITNLGAGITTDSAGNTLTNKYYALVIWGNRTEKTADCKFYVNVPAGSYNSYDAARTDALGYNNFSIPTEFKGTGFLVYRLVMRNNSGTSWTLDTGGAGDDLRGTIPGTTAGSSSTVATDFSDALFTVFNNADNTRIVDLDVSGVATSTTRTLTIPDANGTIALTSQLLTDPVPIANGGTGQTAKTAAFDALSPVTTQGDLIVRDASNNVRLAIGTAAQVLTVNAGATAPEWADAASSSGLYSAIAILKDEKTSGTAGGGASATTWNPRDLNVEDYDPSGIVAISSNQFTPIAGNYEIDVCATASEVDGNRLRLYNVTQASSVKEGLNDNQRSAVNVKGHTHLKAVFTANGTDAYRIDHYTNTANAGDGLGVAVSTGGNECYMELVLRKLT